MDEFNLYTATISSANSFCFIDKGQRRGVRTQYPKATANQGDYLDELREAGKVIPL